MKWTGVLLAGGLILGLGCHVNNGLVEPRGQVGKVTLTISQAPAQITQVVATLSRQTVVNLTMTLTVVDSAAGASGSFADVPVGTWHLKVEALDATSVVRFRGESDVEVFGGQTSDVDLVLLPTSGAINIRVRWGGTTAPAVFDEEFAGTSLDLSKWVLVAGNGAVTVAGGKATISCPSGGIFPYLLPKSNPIPSQGDFSFRVGMRYVSPESAGNGLKGTREGYDPLGEVLGFWYWQDNWGLRVSWGGTSDVILSPTADTAYHTYEWRCIRDIYSFYFDGQLIGSGPTPARPTSFFIGHPPVISLPAWSSQEIDYIRVEPLARATTP